MPSHTEPCGLSIPVIADAGIPPASVGRVQALAARAAEELHRALGAAGEARVRITDDAHMAAVHERHTGVAGTTDVLTFDLRTTNTPTGEPGMLDADILICWDEAVRQSRERGHPAEHEALLYIVHGCLHCLGYDDRTDDGFRRMHDTEDRILTAAGVGALFGSG